MWQTGLLLLARAAFVIITVTVNPWSASDRVSGCYMKDHEVHTYNNINKDNVDTILRELSTHGSTITGSNPWIVNTHKHGVTLHGIWDEAMLTLTITITGADWYVPRKTVWENIDPLMNKVHDPA